MSEYSTVKINDLPMATSVTDNDSMLIIQGRTAKIVRPSLMKGPTGEAGASAYLRYEGDWVQWKMGINGSWQNLVSVADIMGPSAYRIALDHGYKGTEAEWVASLSQASEEAAETALEMAKTAAERLEELSDNREYIGEDGYWYRYNEKTKEYENTGYLSRGYIMYALFEIDPFSGSLVMETDTEYTGPEFEINKHGELTFSIE